MVKKIEYPLLEVLGIKRKRVDEAFNILQNKRRLLKEEENKLRACEKARDKVLKHRNDKLRQLDEILQDLTTSEEIQRSKVYIEVVNEKLKIEEEKVNKQKEAVQQAEKEVERAEENWREKRKEVEKLETHQEQWTKQMKQELAQAEAKEQEEIGSTMFLSKHFNRK
jgi:flagellar biosynthesis chaperone FliJ